MDIDGDDDSAFGEISEFEEGSSYSMSVFSTFSCTQLDRNAGGSQSSEAGYNESLELPGAELRIEGDFKCAASFFCPYHFY
jgi:hypothetical protein